MPELRLARRKSMTLVSDLVRCFLVILPFAVDAAVTLFFKSICDKSEF